MKTVVRAIALLLGVALASPGCTGETGRERFSFEAAAGGTERADPGPLTFTNQRGWSITLTKADVTLGPVYLNVLAPLRDDNQSLLGRLFVRNAWAAGEDHLGGGRIVGEVLSQVRFSALSPGLVAFPSLGSITQEDVRTAEVWFYPEPGVTAETKKIDTVALEVAGTATREGTTVAFRGSLVLDDAWQPDMVAGSRAASSITEVRQVRGISAPFIPTRGGHLEIRFDVTRLFRGADFSNLARNPTDKDGTKVLVQAKTGEVTTDQVMTNLYQGLRAATGTYTVRWVGP